MLLMRCPDCGKIILNTTGSCRHCGAAINDENASPDIMTGLISAIMGLLIFFIYLEFRSAPFLWIGAAFILLSIFSVFNFKKKRVTK